MFNTQVYTVSSESQHLLIYGVPTINLRTELKSLFSKYGQIAALHVVKDLKTDTFTECYHVHFKTIQSARFAKRRLDDKSFYGGVLHVCYAPEYETANECRNKLQQRNKDVWNRLQANCENQDRFENKCTPEQFNNRKRAHPAWELNENRMKNMDQDKIWAGIPRELDPRIPAAKQAKMSEPKKHYQMNVVLPVYGPELPVQESYENPSEYVALNECDLGISESVQTVNCKQDVKIVTEKKIVFHTY